MANTGQTAYFEVVNSNIYVPFTSASNYDLVIRTDTRNQRFFIGNGSNVVSGLTLSNNNVGICKSNPAFALDVNGDLNFTGTLRQGGIAYVGSQWSNNGANVFLLTSNVGIKTNNPGYALDVNGDINFTGILRQGGTAYVGSQWSNNSTNVFLIGSNVGINTNSPQYALDVASNMRLNAGTVAPNLIVQGGPSAGDGARMIMIGGGGANSTVGVDFKPYLDGTYPTAQASIISIDDGAFSSHIDFKTKTPGNAANASSTRMRLTSSGNVGVGTLTPQYPIHVTTSSNSISIYATGDIVGLSDKRLKTNLSIIPNAIEKIKQVSGYTFQLQNDPSSNMRAGFIAQEMINVLPEVVGQDNQGYYNLAYGNITALLLNAIKELTARVEELELRIQS